VLIFNRSKWVGIERRDGHLVARALLEDQAHGMRVEVHFTLPGLTISRVAGEMPRVPNAECRLALPRLQKAVGLAVEPGLTAKVDTQVGRPGCPHLANLLLECAHAAIHGLMALQVDAAQEQADQRTAAAELVERCLRDIPLLEGGCLAFRPGSALDADVLDRTLA